MTQALRRGILEVPNSAEAHAALAQLNVRVSRLESARLASDLELNEMSRALFINYGAAILSDDSEIAPLFADSDGALPYGEVNLLLRNLSEWLRHLKIVPRRIFSLEDLDSQIFGRALAHHLDVEATIAIGDGFTHSKSLIVSADNRALIASPLRTVFPAQVLYSFNLYREGGGVVPDVSGLSRSDLILPWQWERRGPLSLRNLPDAVERIITAPLPPVSAAFSTRMDFYRARRQLLTAGNSTYIRASMLPETTS